MQDKPDDPVSIWRQIVARCSYLTDKEKRDVRRVAQVAKDLRFNQPKKGFFAKRK